MRVAVTGAGGFIGLNIVKALLEKGHEVHAIIRESTKREYITKLSPIIHVCDILDFSLLRKTFERMDAVIHCAAVTSGFKEMRKLQFETNVTGTRNVVRAVVEAGVKRLVYTSTSSTIGIEKYGERTNETVPLKGYRSGSQYGRTKKAAEKIVLEAMGNGVEVIILNPAEVMGEYDYHFGWGTVIVGLVKNEIPFVFRGGGSFCHALEVGRAHEAALTRGRSGEKYLLGGTDITYRELFEAIASITGCRLPQPNIFLDTYWILKMVFGMQELLYPFIKKHPPLDAIRLKTFFKECYFSSQKAEKELGYRVLPVEDMVRDSYEWYKTNRTFE
jgi:dihydroflavonol-4-reductase